MNDALEIEIIRDAESVVATVNSVGYQKLMGEINQRGQEISRRLLDPKENNDSLNYNRGYLAALEYVETLPEAYKQDLEAIKRHQDFRQSSPA